MVWLVFSRRWLPVTAVVLAGALLFVRLGIWQLDRLSQRRAMNAQIEYITGLPPAVLPSAEDLAQQEFRSVRAQGFYDFNAQVALRNQVRAGEYGFHLLTPLRLENGGEEDGVHAVLVDRGWIPAEGNQSPEAWNKYDVPGKVSIAGVIRLGRMPGPIQPGAITAPAADGSPGRFVLAVDSARISEQVGYALPGFYIQAASDDQGTLPAGEIPSLDLGDGPHLGYAIQWFAFALVLAAGYGRYVSTQEKVGS